MILTTSFTSGLLIHVAVIAGVVMTYRYSKNYSMSFEDRLMACMLGGVIGICVLAILACEYVMLTKMFS